jgi:hypothetical protein
MTQRERAGDDGSGEARTRATLLTSAPTQLVRLANVGAETHAGVVVEDLVHASVR